MKYQLSILKQCFSLWLSYCFLKSWTRSKYISFKMTFTIFREGKQNRWSMRVRLFSFNFIFFSLFLIHSILLKIVLASFRYKQKYNMMKYLKRISEFWKNKKKIYWILFKGRWCTRLPLHCHYMYGKINQNYWNYIPFILLFVESLFFC